MWQLSKPGSYLIQAYPNIEQHLTESSQHCPSAAWLDTGQAGDCRSWHWWQCHWHHMTSHDIVTKQCHSIRQSTGQVMLPWLRCCRPALGGISFEIWTFAPTWPESDLMAWWHHGCLGHGSMGACGLWELWTPCHRHKWIRPGVWNSGQAHQLDLDTSTRGLEIHQKCVRNWESYLEENASLETSGAF